MSISVNFVRFMFFLIFKKIYIFVSLSFCKTMSCEVFAMTTILKANNSFYYSTIMSFHQIHVRSRERAKYKTVIHCSVPV